MNSMTLVPHPHPRRPHLHARPLKGHTVWTKRVHCKHTVVVIMQFWIRIAIVTLEDQKGGRCHVQAERSFPTEDYVGEHLHLRPSLHETAFNPRCKRTFQARWLWLWSEWQCSFAWRACGNTHVVAGRTQPGDESNFKLQACPCTNVLAMTLLVSCFCKRNACERLTWSRAPASGLAVDVLPSPDNYHCGLNSPQLSRAKAGCKNMSVDMASGSGRKRS